MLLLFKILIITINLLIYPEPIISKSIAKSESRETTNIKSTYINLNFTCRECLQKNIFLPEYQNKYSRINELNDTNFNFMKIKSNRSVTLVPENIIDGNEKQLEINTITNLINKMENKNNNNSQNQSEIYTDDYSIYSDTNLFFNYNDLEHRFIKKNTIIYEKSSSSIKDVIATDPEKLTIEFEICKPKSFLFRIINPNEEDTLVIKGIKTDLYQVKIFPFISKKKNIKNNNSYILTQPLSQSLNHCISPQSSFLFQILVLLDHRTTIKGTLYIEFNEKKVLMIPIQLVGQPNNHRIDPIYHINHQVKKLFYVPVQIFNPTKSTMIIKEVIHSFDKIKVYWPNGEIFNNNISSVTSSMLEIEPLSYKKFFFLKLYSTKLETEYGFIHIRTEKNVLVIPVLVNIVNTPILTYPKFLNFGLCDVTPKSRNNFIRMIPIKILNDGIDYIKIGKVYIDYDELFLQFHQNFDGKNIVLKPNEEVVYGYFIFNGNLEKNLENILMKRTNFFGKITKKSIFIETNSTSTPLVEIEYSYMTFINNEIQEISGNIQTIPKNKGNFSFVTNVKFKSPVKLRIYNSYHPGENITVYNDRFLIAKIPNPMKEYQSYDSNITIEIDRLQKFKNYHYYYFPLRLNKMLYTIIPIQIDNDDLTKIYCGREEKSKTLSICMKYLESENKISTIKGAINKKKIFYINFGDVPQGVKKQKFIYLINENEKTIKINNIGIDYNNPNILVDLEGYEYFGNAEEPSNIKYPKKGELMEKIKDIENNEPVSFKIYPHTAVKISINLITNPNTNMNLKNYIKSTIIFYYGEEYKFILSLEATIHKGSLSISPLMYKFEPSFPGLCQKKDIYLKNSFDFPIYILSAYSNDERIIPQILTSIIYSKNKTQAIQVNFDPTKTSFIKGDLNQFELNMSKVLTYRELYLWKANEKFFDKLGITGRTEINSMVTIRTSIDTGNINFKSFLIKPNIAKKEEIDFGLTQIGKPMNTYIEGINPSDKMMLIKLILADEDYGDVNNNSMFNEQDKIILEKSNDLVIFGCNFLFIKNGTSSLKYEYIVVPEKIDPIELRKGTFDKKRLISILYKYGNDKVRNYLYKAENILCKYDKKILNEIIFNNHGKNDYLISHIFSSGFNDEIPSIKNITKKNIEEDNKYKFEEKKSFFNSILTFLFNLYLKYFMNMSLFSNINIIEHSQSFFIPNNIQDKVYQVPPHKKFVIGPVIFKPNRTGTIKGTLFLKNNLTVLYPLKLKGEGGGGRITFVDYYRGMSKKKCRLYNDKNFIIEIDEYIYEKEIKGIDKFNRTITIMNTGNLPMIIKNMSIDNSNSCQTNNMRIVQCKEFNLEPREMINIDIEINPNFRNSVSNKIIYFNTEYQSFYLNVIILLSNDFYESKNYLIIYFKCFIVVFTIVTIMLYSLFKIINLVQKQRREMCDSESAKEDIEEFREERREEEHLINLRNNDNENDQLMYNVNNSGNNNNNYHHNKGKQKQEKKKKNRKRSGSSMNNQKEENEYNNNNPNKINDKKEEQNKSNNSNVNANSNNNNKRKIEEPKKDKNIRNDIANTKNNENNNNNKFTKEEKDNENENDIKKDNKNDAKNANETEKQTSKNSDNDNNSNNNNNNSKNTEQKNEKNKIPYISIPKPPKKRRVKDSSKKAHEKKSSYENDNILERIEVKRDKSNENASTSNDKNKKDKEKKKASYDQRKKSSESKKHEYKYSNDIEYENEIVENNNYNNYYNNKNSYPYRGNIRKRGTNKKYYVNNKKYNTYDNNQNNNGYYNSGNNNQQPKKQITKIKLNEKNAKNLKELFEIGHTKTSLVAKEVEINKEMKTKNSINDNNEEIHKNSTNNINENINMTMSDNNNLSNIKINDEGIEDDNIGEELFGNKKQKDIFNYQALLSKKMSGERTEEMNPTFLNDIKTNNAFDAEQELIKSLKKESNKDKEKDNKDMSNNGELSKEEFDIDFSNSSHFNFDYYFFDGDTNQQKSNDEGQMTGNYEDFKFKSIIEETLNINENPFIYEEQKGKLEQLLTGNNSNREESEDQKEEIEDSFKENEYEQFLLNKKNFNFEDNGNNYDSLNNEDKKFQYRLDGYQKSFEKMWKK